MTEQTRQHDKHRSSIVLICAFALAVIIAVVGVAMAGAASVGDIAAIERGGVASFNNGWTSSFSGTTLKLPYSYNGGTVTLTNTIPVLPHDSVIYINTDYAPVEALIDGTATVVSGSYMNRLPGMTAGPQWVSVELPAESSGGTLDLTFYNTGSKADIQVYRVLIGSHSAIELLLLCNDADDAAIAALLIAAAAALAIAAIYCGVKRRGHGIDLACIALFCAALAAWVYTNSDLPAVFSSGSQAVLVLWLLAPMLACIPPALIVRGRCTRTRTVCTVLAIAQLAAFTAAVVLCVAGHCDLSLLLAISHITAAVTVLALAVVTAVERFACRNAYMTFPLAAAIVAAAGLIPALISFYTQVSVDDTLLLRCLLPLAAALLAANAIKLPRGAEIFLPADIDEALDLPADETVSDELPPELTVDSPEQPAEQPIEQPQSEAVPAVAPSTDVPAAAAPVPVSQPSASSFAAVVTPLLAHRNVMHAVCLIRIDGFGDMTPKAVSEMTGRLKKALHPGDVIAKNAAGYDLLIAGPASPVVARRRAHAAIAAVGKRFSGSKPNAVLGASLFPTDAVSFDELYSLASLALFEAASQPDRIAFYTARSGQQPANVRTSKAMPRPDRE